MKKVTPPNYYCSEHPTESLKDVTSDSTGFCACCERIVKGTRLLTLQTKTQSEFAALSVDEQEKYLTSGGQVAD